jgi:uncharacterized DUF497 family protein
MVEFPPGFQWDPAKSGRCLAERGFDFAYAARLWDGPVRAAEDARRNYGEARMKALGVIEGRYFVVVFTWRGQIRHIISARRAHGKEVLRWDG